MAKYRATIAYEAEGDEHARGIAEAWATSRPGATVLRLMGRAPRARQPRAARLALIQSLAADYATGMTQTAVARKHRVAQSTVAKALDACGITRREYHREAGPHNPDRDATLAARYRAGETLLEIGGSVGLTRERVRQIVTRQGVTARSAVEARKLHAAPPSWLDEARRRREAGESLATIAKAIGRAVATVTTAMRRAGVSTQNPRMLNRPGQPWRCCICKRGEAEGAHFGPSKQHRSGRSSKCDDCNAAQARAYYRRHAEVVNAKARAKRLANPEKVHQIERASRQRNPRKMRAARADDVAAD